MGLPAGTRLGPYEVVSPLGAGGMGEVYRARDTRLGRDVALKVLPGSLSLDPERLARFDREARTLASLNHPHIAQIYGVEDAPDATGRHMALVMELVQGEDLSQRIDRGPIPTAEALLMARQVADALEAAHEAGIVHRDLKPANIKVSGDGTVKVLDFGLAKAVDPALSGAAAASVLTSPAMTEAGIILGTAAYMSPEQARGRTVDKRADIWAFGVVLYEMLTGCRLFEGETVSDTLAAVLTRSVDTAALPADVPPRVRALLLRCLERDPKRRLRDIGDARIELEALESDAPALSSGAGTAVDDHARTRVAGAPARPGTRRSHVSWLPIALAVALVAALGALWQAKQPTAPRPAIQFEIRPAAGSVLTLSSRPAVAVSPDGSAIVMAASASGVSRLYLRRARRDRRARDPAHRRCVGSGVLSRWPLDRVCHARRAAQDQRRGGNGRLAGARRRSARARVAR